MYGNKAAKYLTTIGEHYEHTGDKEPAAMYYIQAADMYSKTRHHLPDIEKLNIKVADTYALMTDNIDKIKEAIKVSLEDI